MAAPAVTLEQLLPETAVLGETWARECAAELRAQKRGVVGAWPGTLSEARSRVLAAHRTMLGTEILQQLARATYDVARRSWHVMSEPDLEP
ncbi:MAG: hypothetical protein ABI867_37750 [Kofleriaceae bacterium]